MFLLVLTSGCRIVSPDHTFIRAFAHSTSGREPVFPPVVSRCKRVCLDCVNPQCTALWVALLYPTSPVGRRSPSTGFYPFVVELELPVWFTDRKGGGICDDIPLTVQQMAPTNCMSSLKRKQAAIPGVSRSISTAPPTSPPPIRSISLPLLQSTASRGGRETAVFGVCNSDILQSDAEKPAGESPSRRTLHTALLLICLTHCSLGEI